MLFSVIIPFYQGTQTDEELKRCMDSLEKQGNGLYETLLYHDGPLLRECKYPVTITEKRFNDWGHSLRDKGIKKAKGEYIVHVNADNVLYNGVLDKLSEEINKERKPIYILPINMMKPGDRGEFYPTKLEGQPVVGTIDAMQLIMRTELWREYGGWYDKQDISDGVMYERFCKEHKPTFVDITIGEHY